MPNEKRIRVLISAYACEPNKGSEPGVGWNWAVHLATHCEVTLLTRSNNRAAIENELRTHPVPNLQFLYYDIPVLDKLKKKIPFGVHIYNMLWDRFSFHFLNSKINISEQFDIAHHLTFNSFQENGLLYRCGIPSIRGPVGGANFSNLSLFYKLSFKAGILETFHSLIVWLGQYRPSVRKALETYDMVLFANTNAFKFLNRFVRKSKVVLETGRMEVQRIHSVESSTQKINRIRILCAGNIIPIKGLHMLLPALLKVKSDFQVTIAGDGNLKKWCEDFIRKNRLSAKVHFTGKVSFVRLQEYYSQHDIFIFPSLRDTSGNVLLEAMSKGLPIITFDHHGAKDIVDELSGIKIKPISYSQMVIDLAHAIDRLASDASLRQQLGEAARKRIEEKFLWKNKAIEMTDIYRQLILLRSQR